MEVSVRFFTTLREVTGKREENLIFANSKAVTLDEILKRLAKKHGKEFVEYVYNAKTGDVKGFLQFLINGRAAPTANLLQTKLSDGDVLAIIPPVGGG
jgi:MoaD family protein